MPTPGLEQCHAEEMARRRIMFPEGVAVSTAKRNQRIRILDWNQSLAGHWPLKGYQGLDPGIGLNNLFSE